MASSRGLTVAVTGPTGDIGKPLIRALEKSPDVKRVVGMARRPFDPAEEGWKKTEYRRGDVLDRAALEDLFADADVVVRGRYLNQRMAVAPMEPHAMAAAPGDDGRLIVCVEP